MESRAYTVPTLRTVASRDGRLLGGVHAFRKRAEVVLSTCGEEGDVPLSGGCRPHRVGQRWDDDAAIRAGCATSSTGSGPVEQGHGALGEVAAVEDLPF